MVGITLTLKYYDHIVSDDGENIAVIKMRVFDNVSDTGTAPNGVLFYVKWVDENNETQTFTMPTDMFINAETGKQATPWSSSDSAYPLVDALIAEFQDDEENEEVVDS